MGHWFLSNIPWKSLKVYIVLVLVILLFNGVESNVFIAVTLGGLCFFVVYIAFNFIILNDNFRAIKRNIIIPEYMDKRPFRVLDPVKKEVILQQILANVNNAVNTRMRTDYSFTNTIELGLTYNECMTNFLAKFDKSNKGLSDKEIKGWDRIMLMAKNMQDDDLEYAINNAYSQELVQKYAPKCIDNLSKSPLDPHKTS